MNFFPAVLSFFFISAACGTSGPLKPNFAFFNIEQVDIGLNLAIKWHLMHSVLPLEPKLPSTPDGTVITQGDYWLRLASNKAYILTFQMMVSLEHVISLHSQLQYSRQMCFIEEEEEKKTGDNLKSHF